MAPTPQARQQQRNQRLGFGVLAVGLLVVSQNAIARNAAAAPLEIQYTKQRIAVAGTGIDVRDPFYGPLLVSDAVDHVVFTTAPPGIGEELGSVPIAGGAVLDLTPHSTGESDLSQAELTKDGRSLVFVYRSQKPGPYRLYIADLVTGVRRELSSPMAEIETIPGVNYFALTGDGTRAVFTSAEAGSGGKYRLRSVPLAGGPPIDLSAWLGAASSVTTFALSDAGDRVAYAAETPAGNGVYASTVAAETMTVLRSASVGVDAIGGDGQIPELAFTADGQWVVHRVIYGTDDWGHLYRSPFTGTNIGGTAKIIDHDCAPAFPECGTMTGWKVVPGTATVAYPYYSGGTTAVDVFATEVGETVPVPRRIGRALLDGLAVSEGTSLRVTATHAVYVADNTTGSVLLSAALDGSVNNVVSEPLVAATWIHAFTDADWLLSPDGKYVAYASYTLPATPPTYRFYVSAVDGSAPPLLLGPGLTDAFYYPQSFSQDSTKVAFATGDQIDGVTTVRIAAVDGTSIGEVNPDVSGGEASAFTDDGRFVHTSSQFDPMRAEVYVASEVAAPPPDDDDPDPPDDPSDPVTTNAFEPLTPTRVLDTRPGPEQIGYSGTKPAADATVALHIAGVGGVPATGAAAVVLNVTATEADGAGYVTVWPAGSSKPLASNINLEVAGQTRPNLVTVPIGSGGVVNVFTQSGSHLVADVLGYFRTAATSAAGRLITLAPRRVLDTRPGPDQLGHAGAKPAAGEIVTIAFDATNGVPAGTASAVVLNVTATAADAAGYVTVWPTGLPRPTASNVNVETPGQTIPNQVIVPLGTGNSVSLFTQSGTHLVVDVFGAFTSASQPDDDAGLFVPLVPGRTLDTRPPPEQLAYVGDKPVADAVIEHTPLAQTQVPGVSAAAVSMNITATEATAAGFVTVWPGGGDRPLTSTLNLERSGQTIANHAIVPVDAGSGALQLFTQSGTHLLVDVNGWYTS